MKPAIDNLIKKYNIRIYNGNWYVQEEKLREVLERIVDEVYVAGVDMVEADNEDAVAHYEMGRWK